jgi:hypothetical protein
MNAQADEIITVAEGQHLPEKLLAIHRQEETAQDLVSAEVRAQWQRAEENAHREWIESLRMRACDKAARDANLVNGAALLLWIEPDGSLNARRIDRSESLVREFVADFLRRR